MMKTNTNDDNGPVSGYSEESEQINAKRVVGDCRLW